MWNDFTKPPTTCVKLHGLLPIEDQEDLALSAVMAFCLGVRQGNIRYQGDRQLFALLHKVIQEKIFNLWRFRFAQKRDIRQVETLKNLDVDAAFSSPIKDQTFLENLHVTPDEQPAVDRILTSLQAELHGLFSELIAKLDEHPRKLLLAMLETDATNDELAKKIDRSVASVARYRLVIRRKIKELNN